MDTDKKLRWIMDLCINFFFSLTKYFSLLSGSAVTANSVLLLFLWVTALSIAVMSFRKKLAIVWNLST